MKKKKMTLLAEIEYAYHTNFTKGSIRPDVLLLNKVSYQEFIKNLSDTNSLPLTTTNVYKGMVVVITSNLSVEYELTSTRLYSIVRDDDNNLIPGEIFGIR